MVEQVLSEGENRPQPANKSCPYKTPAPHSANTSSETGSFLPAFEREQGKYVDCTCLGRNFTLKGKLSISSSSAEFCSYSWTQLYNFEDNKKPSWILLRDITHWLRGMLFIFYYMGVKNKIFNEWRPHCCGKVPVYILCIWPRFHQIEIF